MGKEKPATNVAQTMKRRLHMEGKRIRPSVLDFTSKSLIFVDIRPPKKYHEKHIRHSFNIPAGKWKNAPASDFYDFLCDIYFIKLLQHLCSHNHQNGDNIGNFISSKV